MELGHKNQRSLGVMLREARLAQNITIEELSASTKIHKRLIQVLESDSYQKFPNRVYVLGFLKSMSEALRFNLKDAVALYELQAWKNEQGALPEIKKEIPIPDKIISFHIPIFFKQKAKIKAKWVVAASLLILCFLILSPLIVGVQETVKKEDKKKVETKVSAKIVNPKLKSKNIERKIAYIQGSQKVSINAVNGSSWVSFKVDKNPVRQLTLKKGSSIILSGEKIRLTLGNQKALEITNNSVVVSRFKANKNKTTSVTFPQKNLEQKNESGLVITQDKTQLKNPRL